MKGECNRCGFRRVLHRRTVRNHPAMLCNACWDHGTADACQACGHGGKTHAVHEPGQPATRWLCFSCRAAVQRLTEGNAPAVCHDCGHDGLTQQVRFSNGYVKALCFRCRKAVVRADALPTLPPRMLFAPPATRARFIPDGGPVYFHTLLHKEEWET